MKKYNRIYNKTWRILIHIGLLSSQEVMTCTRMHINLLTKLALALHFYVRNETFSNVQNLCELLYLSFTRKMFFKYLHAFHCRKHISEHICWSLIFRVKYVWNKKKIEETTVIISSDLLKHNLSWIIFCFKLRMSIRKANFQTWF